MYEKWKKWEKNTNGDYFLDVLIWKLLNARCFNIGNKKGVPQKGWTLKARVHFKCKMKNSQTQFFLMWTPVVESLFIDHWWSMICITYHHTFLYTITSYNGRCIKREREMYSTCDHLPTSAIWLIVRRRLWMTFFEGRTRSSPPYPTTDPNCLCTTYLMFNFFLVGTKRLYIKEWVCVHALAIYVMVLWQLNI